MGNAIVGTAPITARLPLQRLHRPSPAQAPATQTAATKDSFTRQPGPSVKAELQGVWSNVVVGDSERSYQLKVPKDVPAGFTLDESQLDAADRHELQKYPHVRDMFTKLQYLETTDPRAKAVFKDLMGSLRNGDIMLRTYGTVDDGRGLRRATGVKDKSGPGVLNSLAIATTGGAYSHVALVSKPLGQARPRVIESIFEGGVVDSGIYTFLYAMVDPKMGERTAVTLFRPTEDPKEAAAAAAFAKAEVGTKYNFAMQPNPNRMDAKQNGWYCSQLVYAAYDQNPAIGRQVFAIKQDGDDASRARLTHALVSGLRGEKALGGFFTNKHGDTMGKKLPGLLADLGSAMAQAGPRNLIKGGIRSLAVVGDVAVGAVTGRDQSPTMPTIGGREVPSWITPGDMAPNDGRKVMTVVFDLAK